MMALLGIPILEDKYPVTMDMWPIQAKEFNRIYPFYENLKAGRFTTTKCAECGKVSYPPRVICPACYSEELVWVELPKQGRVLTFTEEMKGVPLGFDAPLIHAWIDLGELSPVKRFLSRLINCPAGKLKEGDEVKLVVFDVPAHPLEVKRDTIMKERVFFAFEPVDK
ncbi:MAG: zinc ribbon domain-containing protein [Desulfobacterales bacterium]|nr:zinc ribbon domain-containing protein [Desulfobacterales bacterium]